MMVCFMAAVMMMFVGCDKESISPIIPDGALPGLFSVSATKQVHFSQGNLQYQASTNTWRFAEHQYDYVGTQTADERGNYGGNVSGSDNRSISSTYSGWIDLFGWGTGSNPTLSSTSYMDYGTFVDWGGNPISNGGNTVNQSVGHCLWGVRSLQDSPLMIGHTTATLSHSGRRWRQLVQYSCLRRATATARMTTMWVTSATIGRPRPSMRAARTTCTSTATIST